VAPVAVCAGPRARCQAAAAAARKPSRRPRRPHQNNGRGHCTQAGAAAPDRVTVKRGDTLVGIANRVRSDSVSLEQTLLGLYRENTQAFDGNRTASKQARRSACRLLKKWQPFRKKKRCVNSSCRRTTGAPIARNWRRRECGPVAQAAPAQAAAARSPQGGRPCQAGARGAAGRAEASKVTPPGRGLPPRRRIPCPAGKAACPGRRCDRA